MNDAFVNPLARGASGIVGKARQIKAWVKEILALDDDVVISVSELSCARPDCPPKETVILILSGETTRQISIHEAMTDLDKDKIVSAYAKEDIVGFSIGET